MMRLNFTAMAAPERSSQSDSGGSEGSTAHVYRCSSSCSSSTAVKYIEIHTAVHYFVHLISNSFVVANGFGLIIRMRHEPVRTYQVSFLLHRARSSLQSMLAASQCHTPYRPLGEISSYSANLR